MINGIDYNGRVGHHPANCDCNKHIAKRNANPMNITGDGMTTQNIDPQILNALAQLLQGAKSDSTDIPNPAVNNVAIQTEYIIPLAIDASGKGMAKLTDARTHAVEKFTDGIHDFRFARGYATKAIVANGEWELVLRKKA